MAAPPTAAARAVYEAAEAPGRRSRPAHNRLAIVVFLALMGLMAARYVSLEHDPRRAAAAQRSITETFSAARGDIPLVTPLDRAEGAAATLRRTGTTNHDPAQLEAVGTSGELRLVFSDESLFEPATFRLRNDAGPRIARLVEHVLGAESMRLEIVLSDSDLADVSTAAKIGQLVSVIQAMGLAPARVAFGSGPVPPSTWLLQAGWNALP